MSYSMFMGFATGMLVGLIAVAIVLTFRKRRSGVVEEDERTELISARAGRLTLLGLGILTFLAWVAENVIRHQNGQDVHFFSPWPAVLFGGVLLYLVAYLYEARKVSDPDAAPDRTEIKRAAGGLLVMLGSMLVLLVTRGRMDFTIFLFLVGFELLGAIMVVILLVGALRKRAKA